MCAGKVIAHSRHKIRNFTNSGKVKTNWRWSSTRRTQQPVLTEATAWTCGPLRPRPVPSRRSFPGSHAPGAAKREKQQQACAL